MLAVACGGPVKATAPEASAGPVDDQPPEPVAAPVAPSPKEVRPIVAVGDLHGDLPAALAVLKMAGVVGETGNWAAGATVLVQTGDTTDRGPDSKEVIELLQRLSAEAEIAGGEVVGLLGNHEAMNIQGDWRYVSPEDVSDFGSVQARQAAFSKTGELGAWLRQRDIVALVGDTVFVHGGVSPTWAARGIDEINRRARVALDSDPHAEVLGSSGPLWLRDYLQAPESVACPHLDEALSSLGARRMVVGHTTQRSGRVAVRCGGALLGIDTGISAHYGGHLSAVRIVAEDATVLYPSGPLQVPDPPAR